MGAVNKVASTSSPGHLLNLSQLLQQNKNLITCQSNRVNCLFLRFFSYRL